MDLQLVSGFSEFGENDNRLLHAAC